LLDQWLTTGQSLTEQGLTEKDAVQLKKRFFVNDVNIDRTDPVQLHLVYAQSKNSVLAGDHPLTPEEAGNLGALECQIVHGD
jgi:talin